MTASTALLEARGLTKRFGGVTAVDDIDLRLDAGEALGLIGPNGAGKSTLLGLLSGAHLPTSGELRLAGRRIDGRPRHAFARLGLGRTHQIPQPFVRMTVLENLLVARRSVVNAGRRGALSSDCMSVLERCGLGDLASRLAGDLTLLQLKRLELARALALAPRVLLLDEIGAGLVDSELRELRDLLAALRGQVEGMVIVEHVLELITSCCDRVLVLDWGKRVVEGPPREALRHPKVRAIYLGAAAEKAADAPILRPSPAARAPLLALENVSAGYLNLPVLSDVSLEVRAGEVVSLLGPNGAGKSTVARVISGLLRPTRGAVRFLEDRIDGLRPHAIARLGLAHCMEGRRIYASLSVEENLLLGARGAPDDTLRRRLERVHALFPVLAQKRSESGASLSGGEQQMISIGRALMSAPRLIVFDEISLGLAPVALEALDRALAELRAEGMSMLILEQNVARGLGLADRAYVLEKGRVALQGRADEVRADARLGGLYLTST